MTLTTMMLFAGMVALHYAAWQGRPEPVQALLLKQPPVNEQALNGETPLHLACQHGHIHVVGTRIECCTRHNRD